MFHSSYGELSPLKLREITRELIKLLEEKSGYPVEVMEDPRISTLATIRIARDNLPAHILSYGPTPGTPPDYAICWQCAFAIRMFECPPEKRFQIAGSPAGEKTLMNLLENGIGRKLHLSYVQLEPLKQQLFSGLITHLRSVPIGLRVISWLDHNYPALKDLEQSFAEQELKMGIDSLDTRIRDMMPPEVFDPTTYINAAHAAYWAERLGRSALINPYRRMGFDSHGKKLLNIMLDMSEDSLYDTELIDRWAAYMKIQDWYTWVPYIAP